MDMLEDHAALHREVGIALLEAFLPHGQQRTFCAQVGLGKQWFARIRQPATERLPSAATIERMATHLPAPAHYCAALAHHFHAAHSTPELCATPRCPQAVPLDEGLLLLHEMAYRAFCLVSPAEVLQYYQRIIELGNQMLVWLHPIRDGLDYMDICSLLSCAYRALDRADLGLYWARLGERLALDVPCSRCAAWSERERYHQLRFTLAHDTIESYANLDSRKQVVNTLGRAELLIADPNDHMAWGEVYLHRLRVVWQLPRWRISEAEAYARRATQQLERGDDPAMALMVQQALAQAYLAVGNALNLKRARRTLLALLPQMAAIPHFPLNYRVDVYLTLAQLHWRTEAYDAWAEAVMQALTIIIPAHFASDERWLMARYGDAVVPLMEQVRSDITTRMTADV